MQFLIEGHGNQCLRTGHDVDFPELLKIPLGALYPPTSSFHFAGFYQIFLLVLEFHVNGTTRFSFVSGVFCSTGESIIHVTSTNSLLLLIAVKYSICDYMGIFLVGISFFFPSRLGAVKVKLQ